MTLEELVVAMDERRPVMVALRADGSDESAWNDVLHEVIVASVNRRKSQDVAEVVLVADTGVRLIVPKEIVRRKP